MSQKRPDRDHTERPGKLVMRGVHQRCGKTCRCDDIKGKREMSEESIQTVEQPAETILLPITLLSLPVPVLSMFADRVPRLWGLRKLFSEEQAN